MAQDFLTRAQALLDELERDQLGLANQMSELQSKQHLLLEGMAEIERSISLYKRLMGEGDPQAVYGDLKGMTILDACEAVIKAQGGGADAKDIVRALVDAGKLAPGKNAYNVMASQLYRAKDRFHRVGKGRWALGPAAPTEPYVHPDADYSPAISASRRQQFFGGALASSEPVTVEGGQETG